jgi:alkaline phosphatase D
MAKTITETFNKGVEGWNITNAEGLDGYAACGWDAKGGDPNGYLSWYDNAVGPTEYYEAGVDFTGDKMAFYGGSLSYDILDSGNGYQAFDVQFLGGGHTLEYTNPKDANFPTPNVWSEVKVKLIAADFIDTATNAPPSVAEMKKVLKDLVRLEIRAQYTSGLETGGLDNVVLAKPSKVQSVISSHPSHGDISGWFGHLA